MGKVYVFDLDHTLCDVKFINNHRWDYQNATPYLDRIEIVNKLYDNGNEIIIETARGSVSGKNWMSLTENQLSTWGLKYHKLRTGVKFPADFYIDDKAINDKEFFNELYN